MAAREGNLSKVKNLVLDQNHKVNIVSSKYKVTPLHAASLHGHTGIKKSSIHRMIKKSNFKFFFITFVAVIW